MEIIGPNSIDVSTGLNIRQSNIKNIDDSDGQLSPPWITRVKEAQKKQPPEAAMRSPGYSIALSPNLSTRQYNGQLSEINQRISALNLFDYALHQLSFAAEEILEHSNSDNRLRPKKRLHELVLNFNEYTQIVNEELDSLEEQGLHQIKERVEKISLEEKVLNTDSFISLRDTSETIKAELRNLEESAIKLMTARTDDLEGLKRILDEDTANEAAFVLGRSLREVGKNAIEFQANQIPELVLELIT